MPDSNATILPSGSPEEATPIKQSATQEKDMTTIQEANDDTHMGDDEEEDEEEDNDTDHDNMDVEERGDGKESGKSDEEKEQEESEEESDEESDESEKDKGDKPGSTLPVRSHLPTKAHRSSPIEAHRSPPVKAHRSSPLKAHRSSPLKAHRSSPLKASRTSPIKAPRSSRPTRSQSPSKTPRSSVKPSQLSAKVSDEAAEEANRPKSSTSDVRRQAQTPEPKPKRSQKAPSQSSPSKPSRPLPSKTTQSSPSKAGDIADFDWDAFEKRYDQALDEANHKEAELIKEFDQLAEYFHVWVESSSSHDNERAVKRRATRERRVNLSEEQLKLKRNHLTEVVTAFQSALALLNQPHMQI